MKKSFKVGGLFLLLSTLIFGVISCGKKYSLAPEEDDYNCRLSINQLVDIENSFDLLASIMNKIYAEEFFLDLIYRLVAQNYSDEVETEAFVLWSDIVDVDCNGTTLREYLRNFISTSKIEELDSIPYLQIYILNFQKWDKMNVPSYSSYPPLISNSSIIDDVDISEVTVYDNSGKKSIMKFDLDYDYENTNDVYTIISVNEERLLTNIDTSRAILDRPLHGSRIVMKRIYVRRPRSLEHPFWGKADMQVYEKGNTFGIPEMKVKNRKKCSVYRQRSKTYDLNDDNNTYCEFGVRELDWPSKNEVIIKKGLLEAITSTSFNITVLGHNQGDKYECGDEGTRCDYVFELDTW